MLDPTGPGSNASMFKRVGGAISLKDTTNSFAVPTGRCATVVVAAADSLNKEAADVICDGVNDAALIQAAIDDLVGPAHIHCMPGRLVFTSAVTLDHEWLQLSGSFGTQIDLDHSGSWVDKAFILAADHIEISGFNFEFTDTTVAPSMPPRCISPEYNEIYENVYIHHCHCLGIPTAGTLHQLHTTISKAFETGAGKNWRINNNTFKGCSWEGISIGNMCDGIGNGYAENIIANGNIIKGLDDRCFGGLVVEHGATGCIMSNNRVSNMNSPSGYGIYVIAGDDRAESRQTVVSGNNIDHVKRGIYVAWGGALETVISGNNVCDATYAGIYIANYSKNVQITGNNLYGSPDIGIFIDSNSRNIGIVGNSICGNDYGVRLGDNISEVSIRGNGFGYTQRYHVGTAGAKTLSHIYIDGNTMTNANCYGYDSSYQAIMIDAGGTVSDLRITNNIFGDTQEGHTTTLDGAVSIGDSEIVVDDPYEFVEYSMIRIGSGAGNYDYVRIAAIDYISCIIQLQSTLIHDNIDGAPVAGYNTFTHGSITAPAGFVAMNNKGFVTENSGTDTVALGATTKAVTHGLAVTPAAGDITIVPTGTWAAVTNFWISAYASDTFTVTVDQMPGGAGFPFAWKAIVL